MSQLSTTADIPKTPIFYIFLMTKTSISKVQKSSVVSIASMKYNISQIMLHERLANFLWDKQTIFEKIWNPWLPYLQLPIKPLSWGRRSGPRPRGATFSIFSFTLYYYFLSHFLLLSLQNQLHSNRIHNYGSQVPYLMRLLHSTVH